ncbi:c-type cytochrome [Methylobrevis pamukkalensis]|uniref:Cytochrome c2 n=1 Tax=Methylobrevis pamukkalensis TaxID=1439726 RepID=A0A1E3H5R9_9HYPH|nr:c-type cytochrome [Methylobrevis pamukkalensis]ODN71678.1 Cytochrome c2 [Methylobrevis pamukkalensis]
MQSDRNNGDRVTTRRTGAGWPKTAALATLVAATIPAAALAQDADGERLFGQRCGACHTLDGAARKPGPSLAGVADRPAGSVPGFRFSEALRSSGLVWDRATLDAFLADPRRLVPGTLMTVRITDEGQRRALIAFITRQR